MKTAPRIALTLLLAMGVVSLAHADPPTQFGPDINAPGDEPAPVDAASKDSSTSDETQAKAPEKDNVDNDWLLHGYEKARAASDPGFTDKNTNLYYRITTDKDLAKLAGLSAPDDTTMEQPATLHAGATGSSASGPTLRADPVDPSTQTFNPFAFKPLIAPTGTPNAAGYNFFNPVGLPATARPAPPAETSDPSESDLATDASAMDTPGMTALEKDPAMDAVPTDETFDISANEALPQDNSHGEGKDELPLSTNLERLQKQDDASLQVPGTPTKVVPPVPINPVQIKLPVDLMPMKMIPQSPVHPAIADPRDLLFQ